MTIRIGARKKRANRRTETMTRRVSFLLGILFFAFTAEGAAESTPSAPAASPPPPAGSRVLTVAPNDLWDHVLAVLKEKGLSVANADKDAKKITTATYKYFRIFSAKFPPIEKDYRDTYTITINAEPGGSKASKVMVDRAFEMYDPAAKTWVAGDPVKENAGISADEILEAVELRTKGTG